MTLASKILMGAILVSSLVLFYLAGKVLDTNDGWRKVESDYKAALKVAKENNEEKRRGDHAARIAPVRLEQGLRPGGADGQPGIAQLRVALHELITDRGRVWTDARRGQVNPETGEISVSVDNPFPHQIKDKMIVYLFEQPDGGRPALFLGEFLVTGVAEATVAMQATSPLTERQQQQLNGAREPLMITEIMPSDRHAVFEQLSDEELAELLPDNVEQEYILHGQEPPAGTPPERIVNGKYERPLRNYGKLIDDAHFAMTQIQERLRVAQTGLDMWTKTVERFNAQNMAQDALIAATQQQVEETKGELAIVEQRAMALSTELASTQQEIDRLMAENKQLAEKWTAAQMSVEVSAVPASNR